MNNVPAGSPKKSSGNLQKDLPESRYNHKLRVYTNITQMVSNPDNPTPIVRINKIPSNKDFEIYIKLERYNPFGSIKDRIALEMLSGLNRGDKTIVEPSSGNTGIALVSLANALGIPVEIAVPERIPEEKKVLLKFSGAKVLEADDSLCPLYPTEGARGLVNALIKSPATRDKYISPNQYENELNVLAHYKSTAPEIWRQTAGKINYFFAGMGTCGTITGVGKYLKERNPDIQIIGVEPASANHKLPGLKRITGLSEELIPKILDKSVINDIIAVSDNDAYLTAAELARKEGILVGPTTGAILYAALQYAQSRKGLAVAISPDDAFKYTSFYKDFLAQEIITPQIKESDLSNLVCPLSKIKALELLNSLKEGESLKIILGDADSLKSIAQEVKNRGLKLEFNAESESRLAVLIKR